MPLKLASTLVGHEGDVKAVRFAPGGVVTASRDGTARYWPEGGAPYIIYESAGFLNSLAVDFSTGRVFIGSQDALICSVDVTNPSQQEYYLGHESNVCSLNYSHGLLVSGSWDTTARVWHSPTESIVLRGHTQAVWGVLALSPTRVLTAGADKMIKLWDATTGKLLKEFSGHSDAVRGLCAIPEGFASCSNDSTVKLWNLQGALPLSNLTGHTSFVYSVASAGGFLVSGGEDRTVRIWRGAPQQVITLPSVSQWCVDVTEDGDVVIGSSDNKARIFSYNEKKWLPEAEQREFEESLAASAIGKDQEISEESLSDISVLKKAGKEGQVAVVKESGATTAYQYSVGRWIKIGDVVGHGTSDGAKASYQGREYDYVFDVDIEEGAPPLKLPFNNSDNVYIVAENFVATNQLPQSYVEQVVQFLIKNTEATKFDDKRQAPSSKNVKPAEGALRYNDPVYLKSFQPAMAQAFAKAAAAEGKPESIDGLLSALPASASELMRIALQAVQDWSPDHKLAALDALRVSIADAATIPLPSILPQLLSCLEPEVPKHALLAVRGLTNLTARSDDAVKQVSALSQALKMIEAFSKVTPAFQIAAASLLLNLTVKNFGGSLVQTMQWLSRLVSDPEAKYRLALAVGVRAHRMSSEISGLKSLKGFIAQPGEQRFVELSHAIIPLLS